MRVNVGVDPKLLMDQHLVAESVECKICPGFIRHRLGKSQNISDPPPTFRLSKGHILFFTDKLGYLAQRLAAVNEEMRARGFKPGAPDYIDPLEFGEDRAGNWQPNEVAANLLKDRITEKLRAKDSGFWRLHRKNLDYQELDRAIEAIVNSKVHTV